MRAVIRGGRWVNEHEEPLDPVELHQVSRQLNRIHSFTKGVTNLTHDKIEILSSVLDATPDQERAILKILTMSKKEIEQIL